MSDLPILHAPRISAALFARILMDAGSPAAPESDACYRAIATRDVDPAVGLAMFAHESAYGTQGAARTTRNWGNLRAGTRAIGAVAGFAAYARWQDGAADWADLLRRYATLGIHGHPPMPTVRAALPVYAPSSDHNTPEAYADAVIALVTRWQGWRMMRVIGDGTRVRPAPRVDSAILRTLPAGMLVVVDHIIADGGAIPAADSSRRWAMLTSGTWVAAHLLGEAA